MLRAGTNGINGLPAFPKHSTQHARFVVRSHFPVSKKPPPRVETAAAFGPITQQPRSGCLTLGRCGYFREVLIELKVVLILPPMPLTAAMITSEMPAAIRPYSIAVAPDSSFKKRTKSLGILKPLADEGSTMTARDFNGVKSIVQKPCKTAAVAKNRALMENFKPAGRVNGLKSLPNRKRFPFRRCPRWESTISFRRR